MVAKSKFEVVDCKKQVVRSRKEGKKARKQDCQKAKKKA